MRVYITQKDINEGVRHSVRSCPVALSLKRRGFKKVLVGSRVIKLDNKPFYYFSDKVKDFIYSFDTNKSVKPFYFTLKDEAGKG